jgi:hypothetical protein
MSSPNFLELVAFALNTSLTSPWDYPLISLATNSEFANAEEVFTNPKSNFFGVTFEDNFIFIKRSHSAFFVNI